MEYGLTPDPDGADADLQDIERSYGARGGIFEVVEQDGRIVGTVGLLPVGDDVCELRKMYLLPEARGRGLGPRLLERMIASARARGFRRIELETAACLKQAVRMYERYGFRPDQGEIAVARCDFRLGLDLNESEPMNVTPGERPAGR